MNKWVGMILGAVLTVILGTKGGYAETPFGFNVIDSLPVPPQQSVLGEDVINIKEIQADCRDRLLPMIDFDEDRYDKFEIKFEPYRGLITDEIADNLELSPEVTSELVILFEVVHDNRGDAEDLQEYIQERFGVYLEGSRLRNFMTNLNFADSLYFRVNPKSVKLVSKSSRPLLLKNGIEVPVSVDASQDVEEVMAGVVDWMAKRHEGLTRADGLK